VPAFGSKDLRSAVREGSREPFQVGRILVENTQGDGIRAMDWNDILVYVLGENRSQTVPIREEVVRTPGALCAICKAVGGPETPILQVECCGRLLCAPCYRHYFYGAVEFNKLSQVGNSLTSLLRDLLVVPGLVDQYRSYKLICRYCCPFCKATTVYNYRDNQKTVRKRLI
jgi:hypothetical protein